MTHRIAIGAVVLLAVALAIDAATSTAPAPDVPPQTLTLFRQSPGIAEQKLQTRIKEVDIRNATLDEALAWVADEAGLNIIRDGDIIGSERTVTLRLRDVTAAELLETICRMQPDLGPDSVEADGSVVYIQGEMTPRYRVQTRVYDISDLILREHERMIVLLSPSSSPIDVASTEEVAENIRQLIELSVGPDSWDWAGGATGTIGYLNGRLVVTHTPAVQAKVARLIDALRMTSDIPQPPTQ